MKTVNFTNIHIENFGKNSEAIGGKTIDSELGHRTVISGCNASGKSTIKRAIMYILGARDENGKEITGIRPHDENGVDVDGLTTVVELGVSVDGVENTLKRTCFQEKSRSGEYTGKDNIQYFVDDVKKSTKKAYEEFVQKIIENPVCISARELLEKDTAGRRAILEQFSTHSVDDMIDAYPEFEPIRGKLRANTVADLKKACRDKIKTKEKERDKVVTEIEVKQRDKVDIDIAEAELQKKALEEQISEVKAKQESNSKILEARHKESDGILELQMKIADLERETNVENNRKRMEIEKEITSMALSIQKHAKTIILCNDKISHRKNEISRYEENMKECAEDWKRVSSLELDENRLICPYCNREFQEDRKDQIWADFEEEKSSDLKQISEDGNAWKKKIEEAKEEIERLEKEAEISAKQKELADKRSLELEEQIENLPSSIDISNREDVLEIKRQISEKEAAMQKESSADEIRKRLQSELEDLQRQMREVDDKFAIVKRNNEIDDTISDLRKKQRGISQEIADVEKELSLLRDFERTKAQVLEDDVNENFSIVQWRMFREQANGELADICSPFVDGTSYDTTLNYGSKILAEIDICLSFQKMYGIQVPVIVDNTESIDTEKIPDVPNQLILFRRADCNELKVECLEG